VGGPRTASRGQGEGRVYLRFNFLDRRCTSCESCRHGSVVCAPMNDVELLKDGDIRSPLLRRIHAPGASRVIEELGLLRGEIRIDVAVISSVLEGFEIKSGKDTLSRLPRQSAAYGRIFDRVTLVTVSRHASHAQRILPSWWGIWTIHLENDQLYFEDVRSAAANPMCGPHSARPPSMEGRGPGTFGAQGFW